MPVRTLISMVLSLRSSQPNHFGLEQLVQHGQPDADRESQEPLLRRGRNLAQSDRDLLGQVLSVQVSRPAHKAGTRYGCHWRSLLLVWTPPSLPQRQGGVEDRPQFLRSSGQPHYLFVHHFPRGFQGSPETAAAAAAWFEQLAPHLAGRSTLATSEPHEFGDPSAEPIPTAFEVITADDLESAIALAGAWPLVSRGGRIEVRELTTDKFSPPAATAGAEIARQGSLSRV